MSNTFGYAESVESLANDLIATYHPELATARIKYVFAEKASKKGGRAQVGKVRKLSGELEMLVEADYVVTVALEVWNDLTAPQRRAAIDHLLERCFGEESEESGEMSWKLREPEINEFTTILRRHGAWTTELADFVSVAKLIDIDEIVNDVKESTQQTIEA